MRVFVAIDLPEKTKKKIANLQEKIKHTSNEIKWVDPSLIHITLKFLGETDEKKLDGIFEATCEVAEKFCPFFIKIYKMGAFPNLECPRVIWLGIKEGSSQLAQIAKELEKKLFKQGFPREKREWVPHLTIGRVKQLQDRESIKRAIMREKQTSGGEAKIEAITVMQSRLTPQGPIYTPLQKFPLQGKRGG